MKRHLRPVHDGTRFRAVGPSLSLTQEDVVEIVRILEGGTLWKLRRGRVAAHRRLLIEKMRGVLRS